MLAATRQALERAHLTAEDLPRITACLALAGATEPAERDAAQAQRHAFHKAIITSDAHAACIGAHSGLDGAVVVVGTGSIGWAVLRGRQYRVGGWGFELSDEGSGAWIGRELLRRVLLAHDGRAPWGALTRAIFAQFVTAHAIVQFAARATSRDYAALAPAVVEQAMHQDETALAIMRVAAAHIDAIATRLLALGVPRLSLTGGLAPHMLGFLSATLRARLEPPQGDALDGALLLARATELATAA